MRTRTRIKEQQRLADAQPDAWGRRLMQSIERRDTGQFQHLPELEVLRRVSDAERLGALRVKADGIYQAPPDHETRKLNEMPALIEAVRSFERGEDVPDELLSLLQSGTSMGGARPKATVLNSRRQLAIAKLPSREDFGDAMAWEATTLEIARRSGVDVPHFEHHRFEFNSVLVVERFDRNEDRRLGYLSADGMLNTASGDHVDYVYVARVMQKNAATANADSLQLFRRIALTLLVNNVDDHLRNHGFLRDRKGWRLAPAFDINPFYTFGILESTPVSRDDDPRNRDIRLLVENHDAFRVPESTAVDIVKEVEAATAHWRDVALSFGIAPEALGTMDNAFDGPNRGRAHTLASSASSASTRRAVNDGPQPRDRRGRFGSKPHPAPENSLFDED